MKKSWIAFMLVLVLSLCGCSADKEMKSAKNEQVSTENSNISLEPVEESSVKADTSEKTNTASEKDVSGKLDSSALVDDEQKTETPVSSEQVNTPKTSPDKKAETAKPVQTEKPKQTETPKATEAPKETSKPTEAPKVTEPPKPTEKPAEPTPTEPPKKSFDINYWVAYAKDVAVSKGLTINSAATECPDNPITANPDCIYLERDISSRLSGYVSDGYTEVWVWSECTGDDNYLIYIGYA